MASGAVPAAIRPFVRAWLWSTTADSLAIPLPSDDPDQRLHGPDPLEVVIVGSGASSGWGVLSHSLGLTGALARSLRSLTQRGVVLRSHIDPALGVRSAAAAVRAIRTDSDALRITVLGVNETLAMEPPAQWRHDIEALLDALDPQAGHPAILTGIQPNSSIPLFTGGLSRWLDRHARALNAETEAACATRAHARFVPLPAPPRIDVARYRGPADYAFWAAVIAEGAVPQLPASATRPAPRDPERESRRHEELERLGVLGQEQTFAIDDIVQFARSVLSTRSAGMLMLDDDQAWFFSGAGTDLTAVDRDGSFTSYAVDAPDGFVVPDAAQDPRFRNYRYVVEEPHARFFAAHRVTGPTGEPIGALCVWDDTPRLFDDVEGDLLRELARRVERVLNPAA